MRYPTARELDRIQGVTRTPHVPKAVTSLDRAIEERVRKPIGTSIGVLIQAADAAAQLALDRDGLGDDAADVRVPDVARIRAAVGLLEALAQEWVPS